MYNEPVFSKQYFHENTVGYMTSPNSVVIIIRNDQYPLEFIAIHSPILTFPTWAVHLTKDVNGYHI